MSQTLNSQTVVVHIHDQWSTVLFLTASKNYNWKMGYSRGSPKQQTYLFTLAIHILFSDYNFLSSPPKSYYLPLTKKGGLLARKKKKEKKRKEMPQAP